MLTVQDDWIQYEAIPARRPAVRGGAACAQRLPVQCRAEAPRTRPAIASAPRPTADGATRRARLRLTRRGRLVLVVLPCLLAATGSFVVLAGGGQAGAAPSVRLVSDRTVVVLAGDSLWSIAQRLAPHRDPRDVVEQLRLANGLTGSVVVAGAQLHVPAGL